MLKATLQGEKGNGQRLVLLTFYKHSLREGSARQVYSKGVQQTGNWCTLMNENEERRKAKGRPAMLRKSLKIPPL